MVLLGLLTQSVAWADAGVAPPPPGFEFGVGLGAVQFPNYPGAVETRTLVLPFPYIVYNNPHLSVTNNRVRGIVIARSRFSLDVDFSGQTSVQSSLTEERRGMPDLNWLGEVGPALRYGAWQDETGTTELDAVVPVRVAVGAQGLTLHHRGWVFAPRLELDHSLYDTADRLDWDASLTAVFNDRGYVQYYYGVAPQFATATRPAYSAPGGYAGYRAECGFSLHQGDFVYGAFVNYTNLKGAAFLTSPLVGRSDGFSFGVAVSWVLQRRD